MFDVTATHDVVLVCVADADCRRRITSALREEWPVRTAHNEREAVASLDSEVAVVVFDATDDQRTVDAAFRRRDEQDLRFETAALVDDPTGVTDRFDARLVRPVATDELRATVDRLHRRARYDRLLGRYYALADRYAALVSGLDGDPEELAHVKDELADLRARLDRLADDLDAVDAFDVAVGDHDGDDGFSFDQL